MKRVLVIATTNEELKQKYMESVETYNDTMNTENGKKYRDAGFDLFIPENHFNEPKFYVYNTGNVIMGHSIDHQIQCCVYNSYWKDDKEHRDYLSYYLYPRSSISKTPLRLSNSVGIIDSGYRGNIIAKVDNYGAINWVHGYEYILNTFERLFQICSGDLKPFDEIKIMDSLDDYMETNRGTGGFGSTGK